jgi:FlaA1/EpsC-like NDP-sugar epimerase
VPRTRPLFTVFKVHGARVLFVAAAYMGLAAAAHYLAFLLRFEGRVPAPELAMCIATLPWFVAITAVLFVPFGLYRSVWRFTGIWDLCELGAAVATSTLVFFLWVSLGLRVAGYPRSVFVQTGLLSIALIGGVWVARPLGSDLHHPDGGRRILIYGAGEAGEAIARDLKRNGYSPVGFVDDDPSKLGECIHRVRVLGGRADLPRIIETTAPDEVLVAMPSAGPAVIRRMVSAMEPFKIPITTLPPLREILDGAITVKQMRKLSIEDLLTRVPVHLNQLRARELIEGRRVLVTGAGGSIGSELCRQILQFGPERLVLYERYENNLYSVMQTLRGQPRARAAIGDVTDLQRLDGVIGEHRPHLVFHAAAHKHVPLMELNPCEAVKNNVIGTRMVAEAAIRHDVRRFILISTDKAVNPSSLMGATKRVAELVVQALAARDGSRFSTVRFGNVLGSNGSVIPLWLDQIAAGGPVTVTHADIRRYFMLIPEAVQLILQAAAVARPGEILTLDMGEQVKLLDMARNLIRLSGFVPDKDIPIEIVGLRPGEKLYEELVGPDETAESSSSAKVFHMRSQRPPDASLLLSRVTRLGLLAGRNDTAGALDLMCQIVPTFRPGQELNAAVAAARTQAAPAPVVSPQRDLCVAGEA